MRHVSNSEIVSLEVTHLILSAYRVLRHVPRLSVHCRWPGNALSEARALEFPVAGLPEETAGASKYPNCNRRDEPVARGYEVEQACRLSYSGVRLLAGLL